MNLVLSRLFIVVSLFPHY